MTEADVDKRRRIRAMIRRQENRYTNALMVLKSGYSTLPRLYPRQELRNWRNILLTALEQEYAQVGKEEGFYDDDRE